jgi:hypothetical protein
MLLPSVWGSLWPWFGKEKKENYQLGPLLALLPLTYFIRTSLEQGWEF